jgi:hypothetical protein
MRAMVAACALVPLCALAAACVTVHASDSPRIQHARFSRFAWYQPPTASPSERAFAQSAAGELVRARIAHALAARGLREDRAHPDVLVDFHAERQSRLDVSELGYPRMYRSAPGPVQYDERTTGTLVIELRDPRSDEILWRVSARSALDRHARPDPYQLGATVDRMMRRAPSALAGTARRAL